MTWCHPSTGSGYRAQFDILARILQPATHDRGARIGASDPAEHGEIEASWNRLIHAEVQGVDPVARTVDTDAGIFDCDYLVLALGAALVPESITGFSESAHNLYDANEAAALHTELKKSRAAK